MSVIGIAIGLAIGLGLGAFIASIYFYIDLNKRIDDVEDSCDRRFDRDHGITRQDKS